MLSRRVSEGRFDGSGTVRRAEGGCRDRLLHLAGEVLVAVRGGTEYSVFEYPDTVPTVVGASKKREQCVGEIA